MSQKVSLREAEISMLEQTLEEQRTKDPKELEAKFSKEVGLENTQFLPHHSFCRN